jgi:putative spermidine/putrescine transport system permease protein
MNRKQWGWIRVAALSSILPAVLFALLFWPLLSLGLQSLAGDAGEITFERYRAVLADRRYFDSLVNTLLISLFSTLIALIVGVPSAIYVEGRRGSDRKILAVLLTIPLSLPGIVIGFFIIIAFGLAGVVPKFVEFITGERALSFAYTFYGMLLGYVYFQIPRVVLTLRGAVSNISRDAIDAAKTLGASTFQTYVHIIIPTLKPSIVSAASLSMATGFGAFGTAATLSRRYRVIPLEIAAAFTENFQPRLAGAMSLILVAITASMLFGIAHIGALGENRSLGGKGAHMQ